jgi:hypothetical protein
MSRRAKSQQKTHQGWYTRWTMNQFLQWINGLSFQTFGDCTVAKDEPPPAGAIHLKDGIKLDSVLLDPCSTGRFDEGFSGPDRLPLGNKSWKDGKWLIEKAVEGFAPSSTILVFSDCCGPYQPEIKEQVKSMFPHINWYFLDIPDCQTWEHLDVRQEAIKALRAMNLID